MVASEKRGGLNREQRFEIGLLFNLLADGPQPLQCRGFAQHVRLIENRRQSLGELRLIENATHGHAWRARVHDSEIAEPAHAWIQPVARVGDERLRVLGGPVDAGGIESICEIVAERVSERANRLVRVTVGRHLNHQMGALP